MNWIKKILGIKPYNKERFTFEEIVEIDKDTAVLYYKTRKHLLSVSTIEYDYQLNIPEVHTMLRMKREIDRENRNHARRKYKRRVKQITNDFHYLSGKQNEHYRDSIKKFENELSRLKLNQ